MICPFCLWCLQTFLVRKCSSTQRKVLCLRVTADRSASSVKECFICEEDSSEYETSSTVRTPAACSRNNTLNTHVSLNNITVAYVVQCHFYNRWVSWREMKKMDPPNYSRTATLPVKFEQVSHRLHTCQSNSVCSITSFCLGELRAQLPWFVSIGGLLLYQQVLHWFITSLVIKPSQKRDFKHVHCHTLTFFFPFVVVVVVVCRDVLPFPLQLPDAIAKATSHRQLEAISHMGQGTVTVTGIAEDGGWKKKIAV